MHFLNFLQRIVQVWLNQLHQSRQWGQCEEGGGQGESQEDLSGDSIIFYQREISQILFQAIKGVDSKLVEMILNEVIPRGSTGVTWADVSGQ